MRKILPFKLAVEEAFSYCDFLDWKQRLYIPKIDIKVKSEKRENIFKFLLLWFKLQSKISCLKKNKYQNS